MEYQCSQSVTILNWGIMRLSSLFIFISLITVSCIEPFMPETTSYDDVLFIEARITDDYRMPPLVKISRTAPIGSDQASADYPVSGADVYILSSDGSEYPFYESLSGEYLPVDINFSGEAGKSYKLILYHGGNTYESGFEELLISPPIDSITAAPGTEKRSETGDPVQGLQFYVSTHSDDPPPSYYRWMLDATFKYKVPFIASHIYDGSSPVYFDSRDIINCWKSYDINNIFISGTEGLTENAIVKAPLNFADQYGDELSLRYSLHVKQLRISRQAYEFWSDLDKLTNQTGGLYESQPFRLEGNIRCSSDPLVNVTGIFEVAGVSESRAFFSRPSEFEILTLNCEMVEVGTESMPWSRLSPGDYLFFMEGFPSAYYTSRIECFDCLSRGGTSEKPSFWE